MKEQAGSTFDRALARIAVGAYDDAQQVRTAMMNRVRDVIRKKNEGIPFDAVEEEKDEEERDYDKKYKDDNLPEIVEEMMEDDKLTEREYQYLSSMLEAASLGEDLEGQYKGVMDITLREPVYQQWLDNVYGVSTVLTARLIHKFGYCEDFERVSNLWSYSGLAPGQTRVAGEKLGFDPQAKTLAWLVADRMIMQGSRSQYKAEFYDPYKQSQIDRMESSKCDFCGEPSSKHSPSGACDGLKEHTYRKQITSTIDSSSPEDWKEMLYQNKFDEMDADALGNFIVDTMEDSLPSVENSLGQFSLPDVHSENATPPWSRGHADNRARRYLAKKFLKHYWAISRDLAGLETPDEWVITHGGHEKKTDVFENPFYAKRQLMEVTQ